MIIISYLLSLHRTVQVPHHTHAPPFDPTRTPPPSPLAAVFQTPRRVVTVLDSPGHRDFVPKMIVGAGMADAAVLVIDGALGGFEAGFKEPDSGPGANPAAVGGQTREHAHLARNLGIVALVVAITKLDTVPGGAAAAQARFAAIREDLGVFLESVGFEPARVSWVPVVPTLGENVAAAPSPKGALAWWGGPTLLGAVDALPVRERPVVAPARVTVAEVDKKRGLGVYVGGRVEAGALRVGSRVVVMPGGETHVVKGLEVHGRTVEIARAGDAAAVGLGDADAVTLRRGCVVCEAGFPVHVARRVACEVAVIDTAIPIIPGFQGEGWGGMGWRVPRPLRLRRLMWGYRAEQVSHPRLVLRVGDRV